VALDERAFQVIALEAKQNCPVSRALAGTEIHLTAKLLTTAAGQFREGSHKTTATLPALTAQRIREVPFGSRGHSTEMRCLFLTSS
jgi:hypothetical protein